MQRWFAESNYRIRSSLYRGVDSSANPFRPVLRLALAAAPDTLALKRYAQAILLVIWPLAFLAVCCRTPANIHNCLKKLGCDLIFSSEV